MLKTNMQGSEYDASHIQIASSFLTFAIKIYSKALYFHRNQYQIILQCHQDLLNHKNSSKKRWCH